MNLLFHDIALDSAEIHLWLTFYDEVTDERLRSTYRLLLNDAEREQQSRFHFEKDRFRYLVTRALARTVLSRYAPVSPEDWIFKKNAYGRPEIANSQGNDIGLTFNISHTDSLILMGVTKHRALGVDVENLCRREMSAGIAERFFAPDEAAELARLPTRRRHDRFFEYWTFKESYIKARGMGLALPLSKFSFHFADDHSVNISIRPELVDEPARWHFWQLRPRREYLAAICAERVAARNPGIVMRKLVPARTEELFTAEILRTSG
jgi:4'-phosphopantetheinyl transferase